MCGAKREGISVKEVFLRYISNSSSFIIKDFNNDRQNCRGFSEGTSALLLYCTISEISYISLALESESINIGMP